MFSKMIACFLTIETRMGLEINAPSISSIMMLKIALMRIRVLIAPCFPSQPMIQKL